MKVYAHNYLTTDHWSAVLKHIGEHAAMGALPLESNNFCLRVLDLDWQDNGVALGNPAAARRLTVAREHGNHFVPVLPYRNPVEHLSRMPW